MTYDYDALVRAAAAIHTFNEEVWPSGFRISIERTHHKFFAYCVHWSSSDVVAHQRTDNPMEVIRAAIEYEMATSIHKEQLRKAYEKLVFAMPVEGL